jgi:hypothetical protein
MRVILFSLIVKVASMDTAIFMPMLEHHHLLPCSLNVTSERYILPI